MKDTIRVVYQPSEIVYAIYVYIGESDKPIKFTIEGFIGWYCSLFYRNYDTSNDFNICAAYAFRSAQLAITNTHNYTCVLVNNPQPLPGPATEEPTWFKDLNLFQTPTTPPAAPPPGESM